MTEKQPLSDGPKAHRSREKITARSDATGYHLRFLTLSMCQGNMEQFVTAFNQFCRQAEVYVEEVRLHEEYEDTSDPFSSMSEEGEEPKEKERPSYIDIVHDIVAEIWYRDTPADLPAGQRQHARIFVSEGMKDELDFYETINGFCARGTIMSSVRAGSPFNRSLVCIYRGVDPEEGEFKLVEESIAKAPAGDEKATGSGAPGELADDDIPIKRRRSGQGRRDRKKGKDDEAP